MRVIYAPAYYFTGEPGSKLDYVSKRARHFENKLEIDVYRFLILMKAVFEMGRLRIFDGVSVNQSFRYRSGIVPCPCICVSHAKLRRWQRGVGDWQHERFECSTVNPNQVAWRHIRGNTVHRFQYTDSRIILRSLYSNKVAVSLEASELRTH